MQHKMHIGSLYIYIYTYVYYYALYTNGGQGIPFLFRTPVARL